jgi:hypothetical protein
MPPALCGITVLGSRACRSANGTTGMTQQYLCGELSLRLAWLQRWAEARSAATIEQLRQRAESAPPDGLSPVVAQALQLCTQMCWHALAAGDVAAFDHIAAEAAQLREFAVCARLLNQD